MSAIDTLELQRLAGANPPCAPVRGVDLGVEAGECLALLGTAGSGRASLCHLVAGFGQQTAGRILFNGHDLAGVPAHGRPFTLVTGNDALFPHMSVARNVAWSPGWGQAGRGAEILAGLGCEAPGEAMPGDLDPQERQLVALARALAAGPRVLLVSGGLDRLDAAAARRTLARLRSMQQTSGMTLVTTARDGEEAMATAGRIAVMKGGTVVESGSPQALYRTPRTALAARMTGPANLVPSGLLGGREDAAAGPRPAGRRWAALLRPDTVRLHVRRPDGARPFLEGRVAGHAWSPGGLHVEVRVPGMAEPLRVRVAAGRLDADDLPEGRRVWSEWESGAAVAVATDGDTDCGVCDE